MTMLSLWLAPSSGMKTEIQPFRIQIANQLTKTDLVADKRVLAEFGFGTLAGVISFVAAVFTTVVEIPGFWRSFWLMICITSFVCAVALVTEGTRHFEGRS